MRNTISRRLFVEDLVDDSDPTGPDAPVKTPMKPASLILPVGRGLFDKLWRCFTDPLRILRRQVTYLTLSSR